MVVYFRLVYWSRHLLLWISLLEPVLLHSINFGMLYFHFPLSQDIFFISLLMHWLVSSVFFDVIFVNFQIFLVFSSFIPSWLEKLYNMISVFLNLLRLILSSNIWSILENVACAFIKHMYTVAFGWMFYKYLLTHLV